MKKLPLSEIKKIEFELLKKFDSFCKENNIRYFLSNGTLLGAVKYKAFIPWDDDIDVLVPREDYNKMISIFEDDERYKLFAFERVQKYRFPFAKFCDLTTRKEEANTNNGIILGVDIDIFPLDSWDSKLDKAKREVKLIRRRMRCLNLTKLYKPDSLNPVKRAIKGGVMAFYKMIGSKHFIKDIIKKCNTGEPQNSLYLGCKCWCIYGDREIIPAEVFSDAIVVDFEGGKFPAPIGYDTYLRNLYGDYEKDPPVEKQCSHHKFEAFVLR